MGYSPPWCGLDNPNLGEKLEKQRKEILTRLMHSISTKVIMREGSTLREVVACHIGLHSRTVWEKGEKGELYESREIEHCERTGKILSSRDLHV